MGDLDSQTQAFISGEVDFATAVNVEQINNDEQLQGHVYAVDPFVCNYFVLVNAGNENDGSTDGLAALKDVEIRQAISMAIGRTTARTPMLASRSSMFVYGLPSSPVVPAI